MAWSQLLERVRGWMRRWRARPAPAVAAPAAPPVRTLADVELPPVLGLNRGKRYHSPDCGFVRAAKGEVIPFRSRQDAHDQGLVPCQVCQPSAH